LILPCYQDASKAGEDEDELDVNFLSYVIPSRISLINYKKLTYNFLQDEEDADDEDKDDKAGSDVEDHSDDEKHVCCSFHSFLVSELLHSFLLSDQALFSTLAFFISRMSSRW
jgi:hypothetical protein